MWVKCKLRTCGYLHEFSCEKNQFRTLRSYIGNTVKYILVILYKVIMLNICKFFYKYKYFVQLPRKNTRSNWEGCIHNLNVNITFL